VNLYVALLRGINVGGNNLIKMPALKACFEAQDLRDVSTYIASGNVLFAAGSANQRALTEQIETALSKTFAYQSRVVVRSLAEMKTVVEKAPKGFGTKPAVYRYDVTFLRHPLTADEAIESFTPNPGVDHLWRGEGVLYSSRLISKAAQSRLSKVVGTPAYQYMTTRNWNTTTKLLGLLERVRTAAATAGAGRR
jgi:uncharacterized protein (DUF1697 family)